MDLLLFILIDTCCLHLDFASYANSFFVQIGIIVSSRGCSMYSKKPSTQVADGDTLSKKDHHEKANNFTTNVKAIETKSLSGQEAGALEILMHSIYHVSQCNLLVSTFPVLFFVKQALYYASLDPINYK